MNKAIKAIMINKDEHTPYSASYGEISSTDLPNYDTQVDVLYSSINYKDALAITGQAPVVRSFPMIPGIDLVGKVTNSGNADFQVGQHVLLNGFSVGEKYWGGLAEQACLKSEWLIQLPKELTPKHAMQIGTAGYTAMLSIIALEKQGIKPESGDVLVTGASGGVGSFAIYLLNKLGYRVVAVTGRLEEQAYLKQLGASDVLPREEFSSNAKPLAKERFAAAVDSVGSHTLANVCASLQYGGVVTACGLAQGMDFPASVAPFILRGISLIGIDSVMRPKSDRIEAWQRLAQLVDSEYLDAITKEIPLEQSIEYAEQLLAAKVRGRIVVKCNDS